MPSCPCHGLGSSPIFNLQIVPKFGFPILSISNFYSIDSNQEKLLVDSCEVKCTQKKTPQKKPKQPNYLGYLSTKGPAKL
jgi:hypothetical protein